MALSRISRCALYALFVGNLPFLFTTATLSAGETPEVQKKLRALEELEKELPPALQPPKPPSRITPTPPSPPKPKEISPPGVPPEAGLVKQGPASGRFGGKAGIWWNRRYYFRGERFSKDHVLQGRASLWYYGFSASVFSNFDLRSEEINEIDGTISYNFPVSRDAAIELGYTYYSYPHRTFKDTQEIFAGIAQEWKVDASIYGYWDFDEGKGSLWEFSLGKKFRYQIFEPFLRATAVLNAKYFNDDIEFSHGLFTAGLPVWFTENVGLKLQATYQWGWQGWTRDDWFILAGTQIRF